MEKELIKLLHHNARYTVEELATMLDTSETQVASLIKKLEDNGTIRGYKAVINWDKVEDGACVSAIIELNVVPKAG